MSDLKNHYQSILTELKNHFQNEEERAFVLNKFQELSMMFMDVIDRLTLLTDMRIKEVEDKQKIIEDRIEIVKKAVNGIENDIYEDDEAYEFEILCPYCNNEFTADINSEDNTEIECPECHNVIELDWNEEECNSCCSHCSVCEEDDECNCEDDCECEDCNCDCNCVNECECGCNDECNCGEECNCGDDCKCNENCTCKKDEEDEDM